MSKITVTVGRGTGYQTMESFGASGAWWAQLAGGWDHIDPQSGKPVRERISELLYGRENGTGMTVYRYNAGGGSANSGRGDFWNPLRRAECFETAEGQYDWSRDKNAVWMMKQAVKDGADEVIVFANSPPERLTINGKAHLDKDFRPNLKKKNYPAFAKYLADIAEHFVAEGVPVKYVSPVNEPQWKWTGGQEGCHYRPWGVRGVMKACALEFEKRPGLRGVKLAGPENGDIRFFNKTYLRFLLNDPVIRRNLDSVDVHSYFTYLKIPLLKGWLNDRAGFLRRFDRWMKKKYPGVPVKMSEWTHMKGGRDSGMDPALEMAKIMFEDISMMNAVSWQHWIAVSEVDFCDGIIYINQDEKTFELTKRYWVTCQFARFVKKGARRVQIASPDNDLMLLAFVKDGKTAVVAVNPSAQEKEADFGKGEAQVYLTDAEHDLACTCGADLAGVELPPRSVTTILFG